MDKKKNPILGWIEVVIIAVLAAGIIRLFLFTPIIVDGESMESTLNNQDRMIVSKLGQIERFDIIVFHANEKQDYIKRVIGLPGDKIEYKNDTLYINGKAFEEKYLDKNKKMIKERYGEHALLTEDFTLEKLWGYERVPEGTLFVLGDNRRWSKDSRIIGVIPMESVIGKASLVYWPLERIQMTDY